MSSISFLAWLYWDPYPQAFTIPFINRPVAWYGICFVTGFILGYLILQPIFRQYLQGNKHYPKEKIHELTTLFTDRLTWFIVIGTIIGARLGHVLFYDLPSYLRNPVDILKIWEGGLASHGGTLGVIISLNLFLYLYRKSLPGLSFVKLLDMLVIPTALTVTFIRIGNFVNQEILGDPTSLPWGVIFGHPADRSFPEPRHPVSLYEAASYFCIFIILYSLWKFREVKLKQGFLSGLFFVLVFGSRFFIDFLKVPQSQIIDESFLQMGQYLSLPFILLGLYLMITPKRLQFG
ncbi:MAG: prolipoprotein diacylglyceryl transferase [Parachlamydiaceae bacterium]|nr:prolipoprotein diacylglyceryl transferase [Parachlamydiaceae bacterium]